MSGSDLGLLEFDPIFYAWNVLPGNVLSYRNPASSAFAVEFGVRPSVDNLPFSLNYDLAVYIRTDDCAAAVDDFLEDNDACSAPKAIVSGTYQGLFTSVVDSDFYSVGVPDDYFLVVRLLYSLRELQFMEFSDDCSTSQVRAQGWVFHNQSGAQDSIRFEAQSLAPAPERCTQYSFEVEVFPNPCPGGIDDSLEENDSCATAKPLNNGFLPSLLLKAPLPTPTSR